MLRKMSLIFFICVTFISASIFFNLHADDESKSTEDSSKSSEGVTADQAGKSAGCGKMFLGSTKSKEGEDAEAETDSDEDLNDKDDKPKAQNFTGFVSLEGAPEQEAKDGYCEYAGEELICYVDGKEYRNCKPLDDGNVECPAN